MEAATMRDPLLRELTTAVCVGWICFWLVVFGPTVAYLWKWERPEPLQMNWKNYVTTADVGAVNRWEISCFSLGASHGDGSRPSGK
jgi:hypothetical protein